MSIKYNIITLTLSIAISAPTLYCMDEKQDPEVIHQAIRSRDSKLVAEAVLNNRALINTKVRGLTPLDLAIISNQPEIVRLLLDNAANVNLPSGTVDNSPLHIAAGSGHQDIVELLVDRGADICALDDMNRTAEQRARTNRHTETAAYLRTRSRCHVRAAIGFGKLVAYLLAAIGILHQVQNANQPKRV